MIARLTGELVSCRVDRAIVEVGGVGYLVWLGARMAEQLTEGQQVSLSISTQVREDAITLFGFETPDEQEAFEKMLGVSGVGPKVAMAILGTLTLPQVSEAVERDDTSTLGSVPGIGPKTARRLTMELKGKLPTNFVVDLATARAPADPLPLALSRLGYRKTEIDMALAGLGEHGLLEASLEQRLSASLKILSGANP